MKKTLFSLMTIALMAVVCVGFSACGSDGDGDSSSSLEGVWKRVYKKTTIYEKNSSGQWVQQGQPEEKSYEGKESDGIQFLPNKRAVEVDIEADGTVTPDDDIFEYKIENGKLYMLELDHPEGGWEEVGAIVFAGNTFELTSEDQKSSSSRKEVKLKRYRKM
jgi:hypothetical protein